MSGQLQWLMKTGSAVVLVAMLREFRSSEARHPEYELTRTRDRATVGSGDKKTLTEGHL